jgi:DUF177 domain-containing protein
MCESQPGSQLMTSSRRPFRINVGFIMHEEVGAAHEFPFAFKAIRVGEDVELHELDGALEIGRATQGLLAKGSFRAQLQVECARCLKAFEQDLAWSFTELFAFSEKSITESGLLVPEDAQIDFQPLIREYALLEVPINPICRPDCRGLCPVCGQDLNVRDCGHRTATASDSPFAQLNDLLKK